MLLIVEIHYIGRAGGARTGSFRKGLFPDIEKAIFGKKPLAS